MSAGFTPGPWVDAGDDEEGGVPFVSIETAIPSGPDCHTICRIEGDFDGDYKSMAISPRNRADARLIAAAPSLYDALAELDDALTDALCNDGMPDFDAGRLDRARDNARAALALARGEQS